MLTDEGRAQLCALHDVFAALPDFDPATLDTALNSYVAGNGLKFKQVGPPLRVALLGNQSGPHLPDLMAVMGRERVLSRLERAGRA